MGRRAVMIFESFDTDSRVIRLDLGGEHDWTLPARLASLVMVASDCGITSVECVNTESISGVGRGAALSLIESSPLFTEISAPLCRDTDGQDKLWLISRDGDVLCVGDDDMPASYSLYVAPDKSSAGKASVFSHIISCVLGFSSFVSFEVRFSVYELLTRIITGVAPGEESKWVRLIFTRCEDKLSLTIVDKGEGFDPTGDSVLQRSSFPGSGLARDLGIETTRRIADLITYESDGNANRILFYKDRAPVDETGSENGEARMVKFDYRESDKDDPGSRRIYLEGDLDSVGALMLDQLTADLKKEDVTLLELDFEKVSFVSSAGVGILLGLVSSMNHLGGEVKLLNVSNKIITVFRLLNLEDYFGLGPAKEKVSAE